MQPIYFAFEHLPRALNKLDLDLSLSLSLSLSRQLVHTKVGERMRELNSYILTLKVEPLLQQQPSSKRVENRKCRFSSSTTNNKKQTDGHTDTQK